MPPSVTVHTLGVGSGQLIPFTVAGGPANNRDWVALAKVGAPLGTFTTWTYLDGTQTPPTTGVAGATLNFVSGGSGSYGKHEIRFFANDTTTLLATSGPVHVQAVFLSARLNIGRLAAFRLKYAPDPTTGIIIGGINRLDDVRLGTLTIRDAINDLPNTCEFTVGAPAPTTGQNVVITYPGMPLGLFGGAIERVEQIYEGQETANLAWRVTCQDHTRQLTRTTINRHYDEQSATAIAIDLVAGTGITTGAVAAGLPVIIGGIDFVDMSPRDCLTKLLQRIGGYWYVDYGKVLHAFLTETTAPPDPLVPGLASLMVDPPVTYEEDSTQLRNRILVTGGGSTTVIPIAAGAALIPVDDATVFAASGSLKSITQRFTHTGKVVGGVATNVGSSIATPSTAPSAALSATTVGSIVGPVSYKVSFKNASGETLPSTASNTVTGVAFAPPGSGPSVAAIAGLGRLVGSYTYKVTNVTDRGETTPGSASSVVTLIAVASPGTPSVSATGGIGRLVGAYNYLQTFVTAFGETTGGSVASRTASAVAAPGAPSTLNEVAGVIGTLIGAFTYRTSFVTQYGETLVGSSNAITTTAQTGPAAPATDVSNFLGPLIGNYSYLVSFVSDQGGETIGTASGTITAVVVTANSPSVGGVDAGGEIAYAVTYVHPVYGPSALSARTVDTVKAASPIVGVSGLPAGCGWNIYSTGTVAGGTGGSANLFKVAEMPVGSSSFTHTNQTGPQEGVIPTMGRYGVVSSIPTGPTGTVARRIYRTKAGGSTYYLVGQINNNSSGQTFTDVAPDGALNITPPSVNINGKQIRVTGIPTGPSGVLARRLYRTKAGGSTPFLVVQLNDNITTSHDDNLPDAALSTPAPVVATAGGEIHSVGVLTGPTGTTGRRLYRTTAGGSVYRLLADLSDNVTTGVTDNVDDSQLGATVPPSVTTAGGQNVQLTAIATGPTGTLARRVYRTKAGGSEYFLVGQLSDNTTSTLVDSTPDASLGRTAPIVNDAGAAAVSVTVPLGPAGITSRRLYRTEGGGSVWRFVTELRDNTTPTFVDTKADASLGDLPLDVAATIGALAGATSLTVISASAFPSTGWGRIDSQVITWTGKTATTLTGIPGSGAGSLISGVAAGSSIVVLPTLTGVSGLTLPLAQGDPVNVYVQRDNTTEQAALAAREGFGTGVIEFNINDSKLSAAEALARADAELALFAQPIRRVRYASRDLKTASGKTIPVNLPSLGISGTYVIQSVGISEVGIAGNRANPLFSVEASSIRFSLEDALRRLISGMGGL